RPQVLTDRDIAEEFVDLLDPATRDAAAFDPREYLGECLTRFEAGSLLFVFDNFETVRSPADLYRWLDAGIRLPNKLLITTRMREFKGDYPVEVGGMNEAEFQQLALSTSRRLGIEALVTPSYLQELFDECDGHPYVAKIMLGEVARARATIR